MGERKVGLKKEASFGVAQSTVSYYAELSSFNPKIEGENLVRETLSARAPKIVRPGQYSQSIDFEGYTDLERIGHLLYGCLGEYIYTEGTGDQPNTHEIYGGNTRLLPSFTMFAGYDEFNRKYAGTIISNVKLDMKKEMITFSGKAVAKTSEDITSLPSEPSLPTGFVDTPLAFYEATVKIDDAVLPAPAQNLTVEIENEIKTDLAFGLGSRFMQIQPPAQSRTVTLELDTAILNDQWNSIIKKAEFGSSSATSPGYSVGEVSAEVTLTPMDNSGNEMTIKMPSATLEVDYGIKGTDVIDLKFSMSGLQKGTVTNVGGDTLTTDIYILLKNHMTNLST